MQYKPTRDMYNYETLELDMSRQEVKLDGNVKWIPHACTHE